MDLLARAQQDRIALPAMPGPAKDGLRVFFQCMELKREGTETLSQGECSGLLAEKSKERLVNPIR